VNRKALFIVLACFAGTAMADSPLPPPTRSVVCSHSGEFCAASDPGTQVTSITRHGEASPQWAIPGWQRWLIVTDDGQRVIVGYGGLNLVSKGVALSTPVLLFYGPSGLIKSVTLGDLYRSTAEMTETVSHYEWERAVYLDSSGHLVVERVDGSRVTFDPNSGARL
jgi:hypothetical protein